MAFGFLTLAAPLTVLGLPGSFGRYVEYFRQHGQLNALIKRTAIACSVLAALALAGICMLRPLVSTIVFGHPDESQLVTVLAISLVSVIAFNYLTELITAVADGPQNRRRAVFQQFDVRRLQRAAVVCLATRRIGARRRLRPCLRLCKSAE